MPAPRPPRFVRFLVGLIVPRDQREYFQGDLEELAVQCRPAAGRRARHIAWLHEIGGALQLRISPRGRTPRSRRRRGDTMLQDLARDVRIGLRMMARSPSFTIVALITMALGIGANTAMFSIVNGVLLEPLPYPEPERIAYLRENNLSRGWASFSIAPLNYWDWREQNRSLELIAAYRTRTLTRTGGDQPETVDAYAVSEDFLGILGGEPVLGRGVRAEDLDPNGEAVVLLDHGYWERSFGADPDVLGKTMVLNGVSHTVIGVLPAGWMPPRRSSTDIVLPLRPEPWWLEARGSHFLSAVARLKPGGTVERAQADLSSVAAILEAEYPESNAGWGVSVRLLSDVIVGQARAQLFMLLASVGLVLLIACVNVAQMTLARGTGRGREIAIRTALGAGRTRVVRQLLAESLTLSLFGGVLGVLLAVGALKVLLLGWPQILPRMEEIEIDGTVLLFTAGVSLGSGLLFGLFPAVNVARSNLAEALRRSGWSVTGDSSRRRLRAALVVAEVSLAVILLVGAGLLTRSFLALQSEDPGFQTSSRLAFSTRLPSSKYPTDQETRAYGDAALERLAAIPGVESAAATTLIPVGGDDEIWGMEIEGHPASSPEDEVSALFYRVSASYFETMGIPVNSGRAFSTDDKHGTVTVAAISESFVRDHFLAENPLGKRIRIGSEEDGELVEIVGVVGDVQHYQVGRASMGQVYVPFPQWPSQRVNFVVKASVPPLSLVNAVRVQIRAVDPDMPLMGIRTMEQIIADDIATPRFRTTLLTSFGLTALLLAVVGLYGVMSYSVAQRSREIGVRMALGAQRRSIVRLVLRDGGALVATGIIVGLGGALALTRVLESMLFGVGTRDPGVFVAVPLLLALVATAAMLIPAVRATRVDPVQTLSPE